MADWASVAQSLGGPLIGALITLIVTRQNRRERISAAIIWQTFADPRTDWEVVSLHVQNQSGLPVLISSIEIQTGIIFRRSTRGSQPLDFEDPTDLHFPYAINPGEVQRFVLHQWSFATAIEKPPLAARILGRLGVPYVRIKVRTIGGGAVSINAADATPWRDRPKWLKR